MTWGNMDGQSLFDLARKSEPILAKADEDYARSIDQRMEGGRGKSYHAMSVYLYAQALNLTSPMFHFLLELTHNGHTGTEAYIRLKNLWQHMQKTKFRPSFPAEYTLCKLLEKK